DSGLMEERMVDGARYRGDEVRLLSGYYREPQRLLGAWALGRALPSYRHQAELRNLLLGLQPKQPAPPHPPTVDSHGWHELRARPPPEVRRVCLPLVLGEAARCRACTRLADGPVRALQDVLALCRTQGIPVKLMHLPESAAYRELYGPAARAAVA